MSDNQILNNVQIAVAHQRAWHVREGGSRKLVISK